MFNRLPHLLVIVALLIFVVSIFAVNNNFQSKENSELDLIGEERKIKELVASYISQASDIEAHPTSLRLSLGEEGSTFFIFEKDGKLIAETGGNVYQISSPGIAVGDVVFRNEDNNGKLRIAMSFMLQLQESRGFTLRGQQKAAIFDSPLIPVAGSSIGLGNSYGDISSINNSIFFYNGSDARVGIGTSTLNNSENKLVVYRGGIQISNPTSTFPNCTSEKRGTIWMTQPGGATPDNFAVCLNSATGTPFWAQYNPL